MNEDVQPSFPCLARLPCAPGCSGPVKLSSADLFPSLKAQHASIGLEAVLAPSIHMKQVREAQDLACEAQQGVGLQKTPKNISHLPGASRHWSCQDMFQETMVLAVDNMIEIAEISFGRSMGQNGSKMAPRWLQNGLGRSMMALRPAQDGPGWLQHGLLMAPGPSWTPADTKRVRLIPALLYNLRCRRSERLP